MKAQKCYLVTEMKMTNGIYRPGKAHPDVMATALLQNFGYSFYSRTTRENWSNHRKSSLSWLQEQGICQERRVKLPFSKLQQREG